MPTHLTQQSVVINNMLATSYYKLPLVRRYRDSSTVEEATLMNIPTKTNSKATHLMYIKNICTNCSPTSRIILKAQCGCIYCNLLVEFKKERNNVRLLFSKLDSKMKRPDWLNWLLTEQF